MAEPLNNNNHLVSRDSRPLTLPSSASPSHVCTTQSIPVSVSGKTSNLPPQMAKIQDLSVPPSHSQGILYPVASSGRGFIPKNLRPQSTSQLVTVANPGGFSPRSLVAFPNQVRPFGFHHLDSQGQPIHLLRPPHLQPTHLGSRQVSGTASGPVKSTPVSIHLKSAVFPSPTSDFNGQKDLRDRSSRNDTVVTINDRNENAKKTAKAKEMTSSSGKGNGKENPANVAPNDNVISKVYVNERCSARKLAQRLRRDRERYESNGQPTKFRPRRRKLMGKRTNKAEVIQPDSIQTSPKQAIVTNSLLASSVTTILPRTTNQVDNSVCGKTPLTIRDTVANHHLPSNQVDLHSVIPPRNQMVRLSNGASLYVLSRSWVQNGLPQESQPQFGEGVKLLPRPLPRTTTDICALERNEVDEKDEEKQEDEGSVEDLSAQELLQRHIKRAKKVRARLRDDRLQRIARYKQRLALLLPPPV